jgi:hypothetical protein
MTPRTFYLETSVWGSLVRGQPKDRRRIVRQLLTLLDGVRGVCVVSRMVLAEIALAPSNKEALIRLQIRNSDPIVFPVNEAVQALARSYIDAGILPAKREADATHVAVATCFENDFLVSWNHRHLTRPTKRVQFETVNRLNGYWKTPLICNPLEACDDLRLR